MVEMTVMSVETRNSWWWCWTDCPCWVEFDPLSKCFYLEYKFKSIWSGWITRTDRFLKYTERYAVLSVPEQFEWRSSNYSGAYSMKQFYLFQFTYNGAVLFVPLIGFWSCSNCSIPIILQPCKIDSENWIFFRLQSFWIVYSPLILVEATVFYKSPKSPEKINFLYSYSVNVTLRWSLNNPNRDEIITKR